MRNVRDYSYLAVLALCMVVVLLLNSGCQEEQFYPEESIDSPKSAEVNAKDTAYDRTTLIWAAQEGQMETVKLLLEKGADVNAKNPKDGATALYMAAQNGHTEVVKLLLGAGADVDATGRFSLGVRWDTGWSEWSTDAHSIVAGTLNKSREAALNASSKDKTVHVTPLFMASRNGHIEVVKLLLEAGADVNFEVKDADGESCTPYIMAKENGRTDIVQLLEKAGAKK